MTKHSRPVPQNYPALLTGTTASKKHQSCQCRPNASAGDYGALTLYRPPETVPLFSGEIPDNRSCMSGLSRVGGWCLALIFLLLIHQTGMHFMYCPPDPATRDAIRLEWQGEKALHDIERREWSSERKERELERERWRLELEERDRREEEERQMLHMYWGHVEKHSCTTYATREYTAFLMNLPTDWKHRLDACKATPLKIHGISYLPTTCEDRGPGIVIGRWEINQQEPDCTTYWDSYDDKGCTSPGSGKKYITQKLMNLPENGNWKDFCATTPTQFNHLYFTGAQTCFTAIWGVYGQWEIDESRC